MENRILEFKKPIEGEDYTRDKVECVAIGYWDALDEKYGPFNYGKEELKELLSEFDIENSLYVVVNIKDWEQMLEQHKFGIYLLGSEGVEIEKFL